MNSKFLKNINKDKDFFENNNINKGKNAEEQFINLNLLIHNENISKEIMLIGFHSVDKNIFISLDKGKNESKKEIVLNSEEDNIQSKLQSHSKNEANLIKYKNDNKYFNWKNLHFIKKFYVNPN